MLEHSVSKILHVYQVCKQKWLIGILSILSLNLAGCVGVPEGVQPVTDFDIKRYQGTWYEIARLDHRFERGLERITAHYSLDAENNVKVVNKGFDVNEGEWSEAIGAAKIVDKPEIGHLKVSFFGPFYSSYVVFYLDDAYQHAYVSGMNKDYLWFLSRTPDVSDEQKQNFLKLASQYGYETKELIWVDHSSSVDSSEESRKDY